MFRKKVKENRPPEWLIVGLGNPGSEYRGTRHNVGFEVVEELAKRAKAKLSSSRQRALTGVFTVGDTVVMVAKPLTFMNISGQSVAPLLRELGLKPDRLLVIADDLDLATGKVRLKEKGSAGGHNGHKSIIGALKTEDYARIKIGIDKVGKDDTIDHVLGPFSLHEKDTIEQAVKSACLAVEAYVNGGPEAALKVLERHNHEV